MVREGIVLLKDLVIEGRLMSFEESIIHNIPRKDSAKFNRLINHLPEKWITNFREVNHDIYGKILQDIIRSKKVSIFFLFDYGEEGIY